MLNPPELQPGARFKVLLTEDREHAIEHWTHQLPRLLEPQGVTSYVARTGQEAWRLMGSHRFHAAVIDLSTPTGQIQMSGGGDRVIRLSPQSPGGLWLLEILSRLRCCPPVVVVNSHPYSHRQAQRFLNLALKLGAFSVINRPVQLESLLEVIRRLIDKQYYGQWPGGCPGDMDRHQDMNRN